MHLYTMPWWMAPVVCTVALTTTGLYLDMLSSSQWLFALFAVVVVVLPRRKFPNCAGCRGHFVPEYNWFDTGSSLRSNYCARCLQHDWRVVWRSGSGNGAAFVTTLPAQQDTQ